MALNPSTTTLGQQHGWSPTDAQITISIASMTGDASYATGGYSDFKALVEQKTERGLESIVAVCGFGTGGGVRYDLKYNTSTSKLMVFVGSTGAEVANATDLSGITFTHILVNAR